MESGGQGSGEGGMTRGGWSRGTTGVQSRGCISGVSTMAGDEVVRVNDGDGGDGIGGKSDSD
jgi:hypothetical protein